jgi:hypothetical protein
MCLCCRLGQWRWAVEVGSSRLVVIVDDIVMAAEVLLKVVGVLAIFKMLLKKIKNKKGCGKFDVRRTLK